MTRQTVVDLARGYVPVRTAARLLGVHENTIRNWCDDGTLAYRVLPGKGRYRRISLASINRLLNGQEGA